MTLHDHAQRPHGPESSAGFSCNESPLAGAVRGSENPRMRLFRRQPRTVELRTMALPGGARRAVVGESHYQETLAATRSCCSLDDDGCPVFPAVLVREPNNPYDEHAVGVFSSAGKLGHLSREDALAYSGVLEEVERQGFDAAACEGVLTGGTPEKPYVGVVLKLSVPDWCEAVLTGAAKEEDRPAADRGTRAAPLRGHFSDYVEEVKTLRRSGDDIPAEALLLELVRATEADAAANDWGVAPWYYEQLAILYRKRGDLGAWVSNARHETRSLEWPRTRAAVGRKRSQEGDFAA
jgi:hypothetical protein